MKTLETIKNSTIENNILTLPDTVLDRKEYMEVKKILQGIGGKWKGGKVQGFVFEHDPKPLIKRLLGGEKVNLKKDFQFFATPKKIAKRLVELAQIKIGDRVLEPSAGQGAILEEVIAVGVEKGRIDYLELMEQNREKLIHIEATNIGDIFDNDFLKMDKSQHYDVVVANPPFTKDQDIDHVRHMFEMVNENGIVVSVMSQSWIKGRKKKQLEFKRWLKEIGAETIMLEAGDFKESGTNVATCIVVLDKKTAIRRISEQADTFDDAGEVESIDELMKELTELGFAEDSNSIFSPKKQTCLFCG